MSQKDDLYAGKRDAIAGFSFDASVASVFDDMIRRSVPGYGMTLSLLPLIARRYGQPGARLYDLGCSLGAGLSAAAQGLPDSCPLVGVDSSPAMLERGAALLAASLSDRAVELRHADILDTPIEDACLVILNFTLQFVPKERRRELLARIHAGLRPGGVLLLSEKIEFADPQVHADLFDLHHDFKRAQGYSDLEISQKRASLENVLVPETLPAHQERLRQAGFARSEVWLQCFNFASLLAFKA